ncbi:ribosomal protein L13e-domain-containing protein [Rhypophila decipiens]|uniref:60S ribosomal protein L13 n=1 Tax=Rhypophila decipiens TaxID=261697 RepID=A0AAN6Y4M6_9PEZI|nr:ribosomal protein L13e-domain-containing protein [Rhypophila decipiens]
MVVKRIENVPGRGLIVKVDPPREPSIPLEHVPCDLVLAIDVSGSMIADAPVPTKPGEEVESTGLSVLDLVKHAARTIVETLNENDRLGIVTFSSASTVLQKLLPMTAENKVKTDEKIESMIPKDATNLWHGIRDGLKLFNDDDSTDMPKRIPALMVLTDGCPNHMCPVQGYVPKLRGMGELAAIINTFGFGYNLRSGLLKSIAEVSGGSYAFIPDAGMVGTVFVHAVANLQSTFAQKALLRLTYPSNIVEPSPQADQAPAIKLPTDHPLGPDYSELTINLHNLQYGQSRDIFLEYSSLESTRPITASLTYQRLNSTPETLPLSILDPSGPAPSPGYTPAEIAYHISRSKLVSFLLSLTPRSTHDEERTPQIPLPDEIQSRLTDLITFLPCNSDPSSLLNKSLLQDLTGQISLAIQKPEYYSRWGVHYLPSLADAHFKQACNSFKDPGPLMYGSCSPLFIQCRDRLDRAFDDLPPPRPSNNTWIHGMGLKRTGEGGYTWMDFRMSSYNSRDNPCFAGCVRVLLAAGEDIREAEEEKGKRPRRMARSIKISKLRAGMQVQTPRGPRRVVAVLKTAVRKQEMCLVGKKGLLVTPWHPVALPTTGTPSSSSSSTSWTFPREIARRKVRYTGSIYSVLLERDGDSAAHALFVGGVWGVTLGHGLVSRNTGAGSSQGDVRAHPFFGDYTAVVRALERLHRNSGGLVLGGGVKRDERTGLAGKKESRRVARRAKAAAVAPRPVDKLRPIVRCPTVRYNRRTRLGRGFTLAELKAAGIPKLYAPTIGIAVDARRQNLSEEGLAANVERLKAYKARLIVFPRKQKVKSTDTPKDQQSGETTQSIRAAFGVEQAVAPGFTEIKKSDLPKAVDGGAYRALRKARSDARLVGVRQKRADDKAAAEKEKAK